MPASITFGHILLVAAAISAIIAIKNTATALRYGRGRHERGTPQYAQGRLARRNAFYALGATLVFAGLCATPLCSVDLVRLG